MHILVLTLATLLSLTSNGTQEQTNPDPQTLAECLKVVQQYPRIQQEAARKAGRKPNYPEYKKEATALAQKFAARFKPETVAEADLLPLAKLYGAGQQFDLVQSAISKRLALPNLGVDGRAETLSVGVEVFVADPTDQHLAQAENYAAQLDVLPEAAIRQQISAHSLLGSHYSYADIDDRNLAHHEKILALIKVSGPEKRKIFTSQLASAYESIAQVQANRGMTDKAIEILKQGRNELSESPRLTKFLEGAIERYSLIGRPGAPLRGAYWLNASPQTKQLDLRGQVTLVQFTAHWCGPCRKSYPAMLRLYEQFNKRGLDVVFATELYGFFQQRDHLKPDEEVAEDHQYFLEHHKLPFKIAIESKVRESDNGKAPETVGSNSSQYFVGGIPQIVLLDKQGFVRSILIGWDPANETRVKNLIETLLNEPDSVKR